MKDIKISNSQRRKCRHRHKKHKRSNSSDSSVFILESDTDLPLPIKQKCDSIAKLKQNKRKVQMRLQNGIEDLRITQKFKIIENEKQCNINKKTGKSRRERDSISFCRNNSKRVGFKCCIPKERIIPKCCRINCGKFCKNRREPSNRKARSKKRLNSLSSISSCELSDLYEPLSSDSWDSEIELDLLIKRTKERDIQQKVVKTLNEKQTNTPTDETLSISSEDMNVSIHSSTTYSEEMNISINSLTTVVLDPLENSVYSPTNSFGFVTDNEESIQYYEALDNISHDSGRVSRELNFYELHLDNKSILPLENEHSLNSDISLDNSKQLDSNMTKLSFEHNDDYIIDTACLQQIKKEPNNDMFIVQSCNSSNDDYIVWNDDGLIEDEIKIEIDKF